MNANQLTLDMTPLVNIMAKLRDPHTGCPWDKAQTFKSIVPFTLEEAYEVVDVIERMAWDALPDELGDLLFQIVFYCQLATEQGRFDFATVIDKISRKLIRRHPHVFASEHQPADHVANKPSDTESMQQQWDAIKAVERQAQVNEGGQADHSVLANIVHAQPALMQALKIQQRVARVGFDWDEVAPVVAKIHEEIDEVLHEVNQTEQDSHKLQSEVGDLLFAVVNLARHLNVDPEQALRQANNKFEQRFRGVEACVQRSGKAMAQHTLAELDAYWDHIKRLE